MAPLRALRPPPQALTAQGRMARLRDLSICSCGDVGPGSFLAGLPSLQALRAAYCHSLQGDQVGPPLQGPAAQVLQGQGPLAEAFGHTTSVLNTRRARPALVAGAQTPPLHPNAPALAPRRLRIYTPNTRQVLAAAPRLEYLDLTGCDAVGDEICGALPAALALNLSFVPISDAGLAALAEGSPRLASLALARRSNNLWSVGLHTDAGVAALKARLPGLAVRYTM